MAVEAGASAIGLVSHMPSGPGVIDQVRHTGVNTVQLCDRMPVGAHAELRAALPGVSVVQVIHVADEGSIIEARDCQDQVDMLLLDSGDQGLAVKELGGTGRIHDWTLSRRIVVEVAVPVFLAGGLRTENVATAIRTARPYGVDLCSGVRTLGALDGEALGRFVDAVSAA